MPGRVYLLGVGAALVALALAVTDWALTPPPGVTEANVRRIKPGMALAEAEALLGGPGQFALLPGDKVGYVWESGAGRAIVELTTTGVSWQSTHGAQPAHALRVQRARWLPSRAHPLSRLRAWLGW